MNRIVQARRKGSLLLALCLALSLFAPHAAAATPRVVRVGYPIQAGLTELGGDGHRSGYSFDFLQELAQYTGWRYEFVDVKGPADQALPQLLEMLSKGEIDLLTGMTFSEALAEQYDYPASSYGTSYTVLRIDEDNTTLTEANYQTAENLHIAVPKGVTRITQLEQFCKLNNMSPTLTVYDNDEEQLGDLLSGKVDALLSVDLVPMKGTRTILKLNPRPFYMATTKGNAELVAALNAGIMQLDSTNPYFTTTLYETYFGNSTTHLSLNDAEQAYLSTTPTLRVGVTGDKAPFQYHDPKTGALRGISMEVLDGISEATGLTFSYVEADSTEQLNELVRTGQVDILASVLHDYGTNLKDAISITMPYTKGQFVLVHNSHVSPENLYGKRLALVKGLDYQGEFMGEVTYYPSIEACLKAVSSGKADYTYGNSHSVQYYANHAQYRNITVIPKSDWDYQMCFGIIKTADPVLLSIFNKVIFHLPDNELQSIIYRNSSNFSEMSLADLIFYNPLVVICSILAFFLLVVGVLLWYLHVRNRFTKRIRLDVERYRLLAELSNEFMFEYSYSADTLTLSEKSAQAVFHCDLFLKHYGAELERRYPAPAETLYSHLKAGVDCCDDALIHLWDNQCSWMRIIAKVAYNADGTPAYAVGKLVDIASDMAERSLLRHQAQTDSLTGIYNAATCRGLISAALEAMPPDTEGALCVMDVDNFKTVNDSLGHYTGDLALVSIAKTLCSIFSAEDIYGRTGGDEFILYIRNSASRETVLEQCRRLQRQVEHCIAPEGDRTLTLSIGITPSHRGDQMEALYKIADDALYRVKARGRNGIEFVSHKTP